MAMLERLTEELARDALEKARQIGDESIVDDVSKMLGDTSTTMQENYLTAVRYYRAVARARKHMDAAKPAAAAEPAAEAQPAAQPVDDRARRHPDAAAHKPSAPEQPTVDVVFDDGSNPKG